VAISRSGASAAGEIRDIANNGGKAMDTSKLLTVEQVAELLSVPVSWVYGHTSGKGARLPHVKVGRLLRFRKDAIEAWIASRTDDGSPGTEPGHRSQATDSKGVKFAN
jgi:excisionase family DNA binding protein